MFSRSVGNPNGKQARSHVIKVCARYVAVLCAAKAGSDGDDATPHISGSSVACREHRRPITSTSSCSNVTPFPFLPPPPPPRVSLSALTPFLSQTSMLHLKQEMSAIAMFCSCTFTLFAVDQRLRQLPHVFTGYLGPASRTCSCQWCECNGEHWLRNLQSSLEQIGHWFCTLLHLFQPILPFAVAAWSELRWMTIPARVTAAAVATLLSKEIWRRSPALLLVLLDLSLVRLNRCHPLLPTPFLLVVMVIAVGRSLRTRTLTLSTVRVRWFAMHVFSMSFIGLWLDRLFVCGS